MCEPCHVARRDREREQYATRRAAGLCGRCGTPVPSDAARCDRCARSAAKRSRKKAKNARSRQRYVQRRVRRLCIDCAAPSQGASRCPPCARRSWARSGDLGLRPEGSNPCRGLRRRKSGFKAHYLTDAEFAALGWALAKVEVEYPVAVAAVRFLLYTGARKSEALGLRWEHIHGDRAVLPDSKSGPRTIWLATPARAILAAQPRRNGCPWVFASDDGMPISLLKPWQVIRRKAGLASLRLHDLRHSHAAAAVGTGEGLRIVAGLLGHADIETTFGYAHLAEEAVFAAANRVSRTLADALDGKGPANG